MSKAVSRTGQLFLPPLEPEHSFGSFSWDPCSPDYSARLLGVVFRMGF